MGSRHRLMVAGLVTALVAIASTPLDRGALAASADAGQVVPSQARDLDQVGFSLDRDRTFTIVGAPGTDALDHKDAGAAYVYDLDQSRTDPVAVLQARHPITGEELGSSVAISGSRAVVGAPTAGGGRVLVFSHGAEGWVQRAVLTSPSPVDGERFGSSVAIQGNTVVVDASRLTGLGAGQAAGQGATYVFRTGVGEGKGLALETTIARSSTAVAAYRFNDVVSLVGDTLAVGDPYADVDGSADQGAVSFYQRGDTGWSPAGSVTLPTASPGADLGGSLQLAGDRLIAGAPHATLSGLQQAGEAATFHRADGAWSYDATLVVAKPQTYGICGGAVHLVRSTAVVGCPYQDVNRQIDVGLAARFRVSDAGEWTFADQTSGPGGVAHQFYGRSVIVGRGQELVGATSAPAPSGQLTGAIYLRPAGSAP